MASSSSPVSGKRKQPIIAVSGMDPEFSQAQEEPAAAEAAAAAAKDEQDSSSDELIFVREVTVGEPRASASTSQQAGSKRKRSQRGSDSSETSQSRYALRRGRWNSEEELGEAAADMGETRSSTEVPWSEEERAENDGRYGANGIGDVDDADDEDFDEGPQYPILTVLGHDVKPDKSGFPAFSYEVVWDNKRHDVTTEPENLLQEDSPELLYTYWAALYKRDKDDEALQAQPSSSSSSSEGQGQAQQRRYGRERVAAAHGVTDFPYDVLDHRQPADVKGKGKSVSTAGPAETEDKGEVLIHWQGYPPFAPFTSWEPASVMEDAAPHLMAEFWHRQASSIFRRQGIRHYLPRSTN